MAGKTFVLIYLPRKSTCEFRNETNRLRFAVLTNLYGFVTKRHRKVLPETDAAKAINTAVECSFLRKAVKLILAKAKDLSTKIPFRNRLPSSLTVVERLNKRTIPISFFFAFAPSLSASYIQMSTAPPDTLNSTRYLTAHLRTRQ